jgi:phosphoenolpyruvate carboxykinase (ATP)
LRSSSQSELRFPDPTRHLSTFDLKDHELNVAEVHRNLPVGALYEHAVGYDKDARVADNGALVAYSGAKTGRSPRDKRIVKSPDSEKDVWWGPVNVPLHPTAYAIVKSGDDERTKGY